MNKYLKNNKGITMISITVAIIILIIITNILVYNAKDSAYIKKLENMNNDIENLREKVSSYYSQYGKIPVNPAGGYVIGDKPVKEVIGNADSGKFYVIDLKAIDNLTLNYGKDYENITGDLSVEEISNYTDLYIINEMSHNIFYVKGISVNNKLYYTDRQKDDTIINLKYHDGVRIPEGYTYVSGTKNTGLKIKSNSTKNDYIWIVVNETMTQKPEIVKVKDEYEFIASVNANKGYFLYNGNVEENVAYVPVDSGNWSDTYPVAATYKDRDGDTAYIPSGFKINLTPNMNTVYTGLVVRDKDDNEYVWISVPKKITENVETDEDIEKALQEYVKDYSEVGYKDIWCDSKGLTESDAGNNPEDRSLFGLNLVEYKSMKSAMLKSIKTKGGFYIGRYEAGTNTPKTTGDTTATVDSIISTYGLPQSKEGLYPYNTINIPQSQGLAKEINKSDNGYTTSLMFGLQWDLMCKFIETTGVRTKEEIKVDSTKFGNYYKSEFDLVKGEYATEGISFNKVNQKYLKSKDKYELLTTGISKRNMTINIYDIAGNEWEETLEKKEIHTGTMRGGNGFSNSVDMSPIAGRNDNSIDTIGTAVGFRLSLF